MIRDKNSKQCDPCHFLENPVHPILRTEYWDVELGANHAYVGRAYVKLLTHKSSLSELSSAEWSDFQELVPKLEATYRKAFGADPLNWSCLMNDAYQEEPHNPHVHWHLIPRYEKPVHIAGLTFEDEEFGRMFAPYKERIVEAQVIDEIAKKIRAYL